MRAAPAVCVLCNGGTGWRLFQTVVPALAASALIAWGLGLGQQHLASALVAAPVVGTIAWGLAKPTPQALSWNGQCWLLEGQQGHVELAIDFGGWLLLRFQAALPGSRRRWLAVSGSDAGPALHGLRAAVYCLRPEPSPGSRAAPPGPQADRPD